MGASPMMRTVNTDWGERTPITSLCSRIDCRPSG